MPDLVRLATAGSVDDGKSTLIGRLLYDSKALMTDQVDDAEVDLSRLTDGLRAEREQGITIDVAYRFFATPRRSFIIADTPGHISYTRNMVTGASTADVAVVLIDARNGVVEQSRRHAYLSALLGIRHIVGCVNKMDLIDWDEGGFRAIERDFTELMQRLGVPDGGVIPVSALHGDYVVEPTDSAGGRAGIDGPPILTHLEELEVELRPQPRRPAPAGPVGRALDRLPRLGRPGGQRRLPARRRGAGAPAGRADHDRQHRHLRRAGRGGRAAAVGHRRARRRHRRRPRPPDLRARRPAARRPPARGAAVLDGRRAGHARLPLRAQAHHPPRARADRVDRLAARRGAARGRPPPRARAQRHRPRAPRPGRAGDGRAVRAQPRHRRLHPRRRDDQRHRRGGDGAGGARGPRPADRTAQPGRHLARAGAAATRALGRARPARRHRLAHRPARLRQVDDRRGARARAGGQRPPRLPARRRERPPRAVRRPGVLGRRPPRARPPRGQRRAHDRRRRARHRGRAGLPRRRRPRGRAPAPRRGGAGLRRGVGRHAGRGVRAPRSARALRARSRGNPVGLHRRRRAVRGAGAAPTCGCAAPRRPSSSRCSACSRRSRASGAARG